MEIPSAADEKLQDLVDNYNNGDNSTLLELDKIQISYQCCGDTSYANFKKIYPTSCCGKYFDDVMPTNCTEPDYKTPCLDHVTSEVKSITMTFVLILLHFVFLQIVSLLVSCLTVRRRIKKGTSLLGEYSEANATYT